MKYTLDSYPSITGKDRSSFANFTINERLPLIIDQVVATNDYNPKVKESLENFKNIISRGKIGEVLLHERDSNWIEWSKSFIDLGWIEAPFYFVEALFYHVILRETGYYKSGIDPFAQIKKLDNKQNLIHMESLLLSLKSERISNIKIEDRIRFMFENSLWANKSDLSQMKLDRALFDFSDKLLLDDSSIAIDYLIPGKRRVDIILDNSGMELFTDLILSAFLVEHKTAEKITLHAKKHPIFVSDATNSDVYSLLDFFATSELELLPDFASQIQGLLDHGKIGLEDHEFWNSPLHFYEMPDELKQNIGNSDFVIFKGDANYRRIFGDRMIPNDLPPDQFSGYLSAPSFAIRILKSEIVLGISKDRQKSLFTHDEGWQTNGKYGIFQLLNRS